MVRQLKAIQLAKELQAELLCIAREPCDDSTSKEVFEQLANIDVEGIIDMLEFHYNGGKCPDGLGNVVMDQKTRKIYNLAIAQIKEGIGLLEKCPTCRSMNTVLWKEQENMWLCKDCGHLF